MDNQINLRIKIYNPTTTWIPLLDPCVRDLYRLLAIFFLLFCSDLAVLIFPTILVDFKRTQLKFLGSRGGNIQLLKPLPPLLFYFNHNPSHPWTTTRIKPKESSQFNLFVCIAPREKGISKCKMD